MIKYFLTIFFLLAGCNSGPCDYFTSGLCIKSELSVNLGDIDLQVEVMEGRLLKHYNNTPDLPTLFAQNGVNVKIVDGDLVLNCKKVAWFIGNTVYSCEQNVGGVNIDASTNFIGYRSCIGRSSMVHELLHTFEWLHLGITPPQDHSTPGLFITYALSNGASIADTAEGGTRLEFYARTDSDECK